ncbi:hypothetical protein BE21_19260 [Sorangium cellulosum]|uniref:Uncharacterized protein n=1 Tax=Sorangium cellulosum TaxID=56 RepID=A0A150TWX9_SORCE|nr:hypothetical protein BE21_19260 [Sorangium cellulosum]
MTLVSRPISARALAILERFPRHLDAARPDKLFAHVVHALAVDLVLETSQLGLIRRAHRLGHADELRDLHLLAALHDLRPADFEALRRRFAAARSRAEALATTPPAGLTAARASLALLVGAGESTFVAWPSEADDAEALERLTRAVLDATSYAAECDRLRRQIAVAVAIHRQGNGTIGALLRGAANALDLDVVQVRHSTDGYWHLADCRDRVTLVRPEPPGAPRPTTAVPPPTDLVALEENPYAPRKVEPFAVQHAQRFAITRPGFEAVPVTVRITGVADRTMWPMVVNRDTGVGVAYHGAVPDTKELVLDRDGTATLDGADVAGHSWSFQGAVFAQDGEISPLDFAFTDDAGATPNGQGATFATPIPFADAFDALAAWPHAAGVRLVQTLAVGATRWAFFVREAVYGTTDAAGTVDLPAVAYFAAGVWDQSVFAGTPAPEAAKLAFDWEEREPFAVRLFIPERFATLDDTASPPAMPPITAVVRGALERFRAAGIRLTVEYTSELWTLGEGVLRDIDSAEPEGTVVDGTRVWPSPLPA